MNNLTLRPKEKMFLQNLNLLIKHEAEILANPRMNRCPLPFINGVGCSLSDPTVGAYLDWWLHDPLSRLYINDKEGFIFSMQGLQGVNNTCYVLHADGGISMGSITPFFPHLMSFKVYMDKYPSDESVKPYSIARLIKMLRSADPSCPTLALYPHQYPWQPLAAQIQAQTSSQNNRLANALIRLVQKVPMTFFFIKSSLLYALPREFSDFRSAIKLPYHWKKFPNLESEMWVGDHYWYVKFSNPKYGERMLVFRFPFTIALYGDDIIDDTYDLTNALPEIAKLLSRKYAQIPNQTYMAICTDPIAPPHGD